METMEESGKYQWNGMAVSPMTIEKGDSVFYTVIFEGHKNTPDWMDEQVQMLEEVAGLKPYRMEGWYAKEMPHRTRYGCGGRAVIYRWRKPKR